MTSIITDSPIDIEEQPPTSATTLLNYPLCGPKSWKNRDRDMDYDEEVSEIFGGLDRLPYVEFGRIDGMLSQLSTTPDIGSYPIQQHSSLFLDDSIEKNTIRIPKIGPGKPERLYLGIDNLISTMFTPNDPPDVRYASGCNLVRNVAMALPNNICDICGHGNCQEQAAKQWYSLFNWEFCHQKCWIKLCENYYQHLEKFGDRNTLINFIYFVPVLLISH